MIKVSINSDYIGRQVLQTLLRVAMPDATGKELRKAAGLCRDCGIRSPGRRVSCCPCRRLNAIRNVRRSERRGDRIEARIGTRGHLPEWTIQEIEANQKEARERKEKLG